MLSTYSVRIGSGCGILHGMQITATTYIAGTSPVHRLDARVKIALLVAYSMMLFAVDTWTGMGTSTLLFATCLAVSGVPASRVFALAVPAYVLAAFSVVFNMFAFASPDALASASASVAAGDVLAGIYPLIGGFSLSIQGLLSGLFFAARIVLLVLASFIVCLTSTSTELTDALRSFLSPLAKLGFPADDVAMVLSIALRFIPVTAEELGHVRDAQWSRGAKFDEGSLWRRMRAWQAVFVPLFVRLFRRADALAQAMESRCYGIGPRTSLNDRRLSASAAVTLVAGCALCAAVGVLL